VKKTSVTCWITLIVAMLSLPVRAAETENFWMKTDRASIAVGAFFVGTDTEVRLSSDTLGTGTLLSFEDDLGLDDDEDVVRLGGHYRFKPRHRFTFSHFETSREATAIALRDIQFEDTLFSAGTTIKTELDFNVTSLIYTYSFFQNSKLDLGVSTSVTIYEFDSTLIAPATRTKEEGDGTAPFPTFGMRVGWAFKPKWMFRASFDYFEIDDSDVEGEVIDILIGVEHQTWKKVGLGLAYNDVSIDAENKDEGDEFDWQYDGFFGYARFNF